MKATFVSNVFPTIAIKYKNHATKSSVHVPTYAPRLTFQVPHPPPPSYFKAATKPTTWHNLPTLKAPFISAWIITSSDV